MPEAASALVCSAGEWPAGDAVPEFRFAARHVFVTSKSTRPAAMSAQHTYCVTVTAPSRKYNIFNCYGVFSRDSRPTSHPGTFGEGLKVLSNANSLSWQALIFEVAFSSRSDGSVFDV